MRSGLRAAAEGSADTVASLGPALPARTSNRPGEL